MRNNASLPDVVDGTRFDPQAEARALSAQTARTIAVAQALVASQRRVDMEGLQDQVGFLCAKALDLPPGQTGFMKLELTRLVSALDTLATSLRANAA